MKPSSLKTKIFLDSGDPKETKEALELLGFLDGQTTNPSLIAKNPNAAGKKFTREEINTFYRGVVEAVSRLLPEGSVSIEVYADDQTPAEEMLQQAREFNAWIPNAHIKFPTNASGLKAAEMFTKEGGRVNMTLVFSQEQAAAVYAATKGAKRGDVFVSPFIGRLDDIGENGMDLIANILQMYRTDNPAHVMAGEHIDAHVEVLSASVRSMEHFMYAIHIGSDIITAPLKILKEWAETGMGLPEEKYVYNPENLKMIAYQELDLSKPWEQFNIQHDLTDKGIQKFVQDWNELIKNG